MSVVSFPLPLEDFQRWAELRGRTVEWGNIIGPYTGQTFRETFRSVKEAKERERQALAKEAIGADREPVALKREARNRDGVWETCEIMKPSKRPTGRKSPREHKRSP